MKITKSELQLLNILLLHNIQQDIDQTLRALDASEQICDLQICSNSRDAIRLFEQEQPHFDVILIDINMSSKERSQFLNWLSEQQDLAGIPLVALALQSHLSDLSEIIEPYFWTYVLKDHCEISFTSQLTALLCLAPELDTSSRAWAGSLVDYAQSQLPAFFE